MLMVCPNCHSHNVIAVQEQLFCINCGQMVQPPKGQTAKTALAMPDPVQPAQTPESETKPSKPSLLRLKHNKKSNHQSEAPNPEHQTKTPAPTAMSKSSADPAKPSASSGFLGTIIKVSRQRIGEPPSPQSNADDKPDDNAAAKDQGDQERTQDKPSEALTQKSGKPDEPAAKPRKQKPGRPRKRLDVPTLVAAAAPLPAGPSISKLSHTAALAAPQPVLRRMSDITPKPLTSEVAAENAQELEEPRPEKSAKQSKHFSLKQLLLGDLTREQTHPRPDIPTMDNTGTPKTSSQPHSGHAKPDVHKVGLPPLHYASVLLFSLRARVQPVWLALSAVAVLALLTAFIYTAWLLIDVPSAEIASRMKSTSPQLLIELLVLAALYYIGRSISQTAIVYGIARETDARPVNLSRQLGIGINTFGHRLMLDLTFCIIDLVILGLMFILFITGGNSWSVNPELQVAAVFIAYLVLLYLLTGLALARGLAGVSLTLTQKEIWPAISFGWQLFSHRFELLGLRFIALTMELVLAVPLAALALAIIIMSPASMHPAVAVAVGLLAWIAGALLGAGTAAWWTALYRRLVLAEHHHHNDSAEALTLLSSRQPQQARRSSLAFIVATCSFLLAAALALPWLRW